MCEFRNNATWAVVKTAESEESFAILLRDTYGKGQMWTLAVPDNFPDLYKLPGKALTRIRREFPAGGAYLESKAGVSLFPYDNDTVILYSYVMDGAQRTHVQLHAQGVSTLHILPEPRFGPGHRGAIEPLYTTAGGESVFDLIAMPGRYTLYRLER